MRQVVTVTEVEGEGLESFLNQNVVLFCLNYIYTGKLVGINDTFVKLEDPSIVYETGPFSTPGYKDAQKLHVKSFYVQTAAIESFGASK